VAVARDILIHESTRVYICEICGSSRKAHAKEETQKGIETPDLDAKPQVWHHQSNHFESTKKVTQLIEQVNMM